MEGGETWKSVTHTKTKTSVTASAKLHKKIKRNEVRGKKRLNMR